MKRCLHCGHYQCTCPTPAVEVQIVKLFLEGNSVNHIVALLNYKYRINCVTQALRKRLAALEKVWADGEY